MSSRPRFQSKTIFLKDGFVLKYHHSTILKLWNQELMYFLCRYCSILTKYENASDDKLEIVKCLPRAIYLVLPATCNSYCYYIVVEARLFNGASISPGFRFDPNSTQFTNSHILVTLSTLNITF